LRKGLVGTAEYRIRRVYLISMLTFLLGLFSVTAGFLPGTAVRMASVRVYTVFR